MKDVLVKSRQKRWLSKNRQMQGAQISRNEAYNKYAAMTRQFAATQQQLATFCDATMKVIMLLLSFCFAAPSYAAVWKPEDIHPRVFEMVESWLSDSVSPVVTEINLDAVRSNHNQFDYDAVKNESGWITYRDNSEMLRFRVNESKDREFAVIYQKNGGGSLTTQLVIRFAIAPRSIDIDGQQTTMTVLRVLSIASKD